MFTVTINLQISFDKENQAHSKELAQLVNEELKQSVQSIQNKYNQIKIPPNSSVGENSQTNFFDFADHEANELELNRRYNTSRNYRTAIKRLREYTESTVLPFNHITVQFIDNFESFLSKHTIFRLDAHYSQTYLCAVTFNNNDYGKRKSKLSGGI